MCLMVSILLEISKQTSIHVAMKFGYENHSIEIWRTQGVKIATYPPGKGVTSKIAHA